MNEPLLRIVIAGGGSAGWMAAAALATFGQGRLAISLVESDAIGTVGVGEATIPQIHRYLALLGIDEATLLRETGGTIKLGIEFVGWGGRQERYLHAFGAVGRDLGAVPFLHYWLRAGTAAGPLGDYLVNAHAARARRVGPPGKPGAVPDLTTAYHIDATRFAALLRAKAQAMGVERVEGRIDGVETGASGVAALRLDGDRRVDGDLFLDCTGFRALLMEALGVGFQDWRKWLPCDRALAMPSEPDPVPRAHTQAIAHPAGWQWRIPLQHRTGNGLVYSSDDWTDEQAGEALVAGLETPATDMARPIRFTTGRRDRFWVGNTVALGLAAGFLEPLESTSLHLIQSAIGRLVDLLPNGSPDPALAVEFNRQTVAEYEGVRDFLVFHYTAHGRVGDPLWDRCRAMVLPEGLERRLALFRATGRLHGERDELFTPAGWSQVLTGQGVRPVAHHPLADLLSDDELAGFLSTVRAGLTGRVAAMPSHAAYLKWSLAQ